MLLEGHELLSMSSRTDDVHVPVRCKRSELRHLVDRDWKKFNPKERKLVRRGVERLVEPIFERDPEEKRIVANYRCRIHDSCIGLSRATLEGRQKSGKRQE